MENRIKVLGGIFFGALLIAVGLYFFWAPSSLAAGGNSGLAIVLKVVLPYIPIGVILFVLDLIMFSLGFIVLGKSFGVKSLICSLCVSMITTLLEYIWPNLQPLSEDALILLILGALLIALGQAMVFNLEASSGGTDIVAKIISKYSHLNIGTSLLIADMIVVLFATTILGIEKGLYAAFGVVLTTQLIDYFISGFDIKRYIMIIPSCHTLGEQIKQYILNELGRGATLYYGMGGYNSEQKQIITVVIEQREFVKLKKQVLAIDRAAFMTVQKLHEVVGEGFKS